MRTFAQEPKAHQQTASTKSAISGRAHFGQSREASSILHLQRTIGNQAVQRWLEASTRYGEGDSITEIARSAHDFSQIPLHSAAARAVIQRKLTISAPGDTFEREADDVADRVMRMVEPSPISSVPAAIQRKCAPCEEAEKAGAAPHAPSVDLQSIEGGEEEEKPGLTKMTVQRKAEFGAAVAAISPSVVDRLADAQSSGELLTSGTRHSMETAFGRDFSRVRVHRDREAAELSHQLGARAFTHGNHIYFGSGTYDPEGSSGKRLLAHELTHIAQQGHAALKSGGDAAPTATAVRAAPPAIQRAATWTAAVPNEINSLADTAIIGTPVGVTTPTFNGVAFGALTEPTVTVAAVPAGGFDATVTTVPANGGSVTENVLSPGPWRRVTPRATIGALFPTLTQCTGAGNSNFRARGNPSDAAMAAANLRHENHHQADRRDAFNATVVPWDTRLTAANTAGTTFHGATAAAARTALFTAMGGTGAQVQTACLTAGATARDTFHGTPAGGPVGAPTDPVAAADCSWSFARYFNPS